jgi:Tol biopolymer transport system component
VWGVAPGEGRPSDRTDYWVTGLERDRAESAGLAGPVSRAGGTLAAIEDMTWTPQGLVFSMRTGWVRNVYRCRMTAAGKAEGDLERLAGGTASAEFPAVSRDGQLVFASGTQRFDVWGLPLDANSGKVLGPHYRITNSTAPAEYPAISPDGRKVLYATPRNGTSQIWMKDLSKGEESVIAPGPNASVSVWLHDGQVAFTQRLSQRPDEYLLDLSTSQTRKVYEGGFFWDVNGPGTVALAQTSDSNRNDVVGVDLSTGRTSSILRGTQEWPLMHASFSPNDEWIVFVANAGPGTGQIYVVRPHGLAEIPKSEWVAVTDGRQKADKPRFSPDGKLIYFTQDRDGRRSIRAARFDPRSGHAVGDSSTVFDADQPQLTLFGVSPRSLEIGIAKDRLVMLLAENTSNIWMTAIGP